MKLRGVSKEPLSSPKSFEILREMRSFSQSISDSQDRLRAREKSILKIVYLRLLVPNVSLDVITILMFHLDYESEQAIHVAKSKIREK
jgi:hypothetical protein